MSEQFHIEHLSGQGNYVGNGGVVSNTMVPGPAPAPEPSAPRLEVSLHTKELPLGESTLLLGTVRNVGTVSVPKARVSVSGRLAIRSHEGDQVRDLEPGGSADFSFLVQAQQPGPHVPITTTVDYADRQGRQYTCAPRHAVRVGRPTAATAAAKSVTVLFLAANPNGTQPLRLDRELRTIKDAIDRSTFRSAFDLVDHTAVRLGDLSRALLQSRARIVHFAGHGDQAGRYLIETDGGEVRRIRPEKLAELFAAATDHVECVIVNACHTMRLATALAEHVRYVVGMRRQIYDKSAISFSMGFYQALSEGRPIEKAFQVGKALAEADADDPGPDDVPELVTLLR